MKILIISNLYPSSENIEDHLGKMLLHQYAKCWRGENEIVVINPHSYNILTARKLRKERLKSEFELDGIRVKNIPILRLPGDKLQVRKFKKIVSQMGKFDFIIGCLPVGLEITHYLHKKLNIPYFTYLHNTDFHRSGLSKGGISGKYKNFLSNAVGLMYVSPKLQTAFTHVISSGGMLLPGAISRQWFENQTNHVPDKSMLKLVTPARLVKQKNIESILHALSAFDELNFNYVIAGDGPHRKNLENMVDSSPSLKGKVEFIGMVGPEQMRKLFDKNDFMILLSTNESFGLVYVEAMARGCIPVGTIGEGIDGIIKDGENGFLSYPDIESIKNTLMRLQKYSEADLKEVSNSAMKNAKNFMYDNLAESFIDFAKSKLADV